MKRDELRVDPVDRYPVLCLSRHDVQEVLQPAGVGLDGRRHIGLAGAPVERDLDRLGQGFEDAPRAGGEGEFLLVGKVERPGQLGGAGDQQQHGDQGSAQQPRQAPAVAPAAVPPLEGDQAAARD